MRRFEDRWPVPPRNWNSDIIATSNIIGKDGTPVRYYRLTVFPFLHVNNTSQVWLKTLDLFNRGKEKRRDREILH